MCGMELTEPRLVQQYDLDRDRCHLQQGTRSTLVAFRIDGILSGWKVVYLFTFETSHSLMVVSRLPEARVRPSGLKATE